MRIGDKVATVLYWTASVLLVGPLIYFSVINQFDAFQPWLLVAASFALFVIVLGLRQCWKSLRGLGSGSAPDNSSEPED